MAWILVFLGMAVLVLGAELLVRGASSLASRFGVSPLVIGLTIVAFGTSAPEVAVSLSAVAKGQSDLALGNAVGSNTFNILVILGLSALLCPLIVHQQLIRIGVPLTIGAGILLWVLLRDGELGRLDGFLLLSGMVTYTVLAVRSSKRTSVGVDGPCAAAITTGTDRGLHRSAFLIVGGLVLAVLGARWMVTGATSIARSLNVSELLIGLTIVAAGTSLPELATSVVAAIRGQRDIAVGNVLGSNLFNILGILGLAGLYAPDGLRAPDAILVFDLPVMIAVSIACLPIMFTGFRVNRWEGLVFLLLYVAYVLYLALSGSHHAARDSFITALVWFVLPLVGLGIAMSALHVLGQRGRSAKRPDNLDS